MSRLWSIWLVLALVLARCSPFASGEKAVELLPVQTIIVVAKNAPKDEKDAAQLLQKWLRKASGVTTGFELQSVEPGATTTAPADKIIIAVGATSLQPADPRMAKLNDDGFLIHRVGATIAIEGKTAAATYYGVVAFLDRYAGVRFYLPTDLWTSLPANHSLVFDGRDFLSQPFVVSGEITGINSQALGDGDWLRRIGGQRRKGGTHQHNMYAIFPPEKFAQMQPEIYPVYDGQRYIPKNSGDQNWQIDFTEPKTIEVAKQSIADYFAMTPNAAYIAVSVNDSNRWSQSERNQQIIAEFKARDPQSNYTLEATSDIYWRFMNQLAAWMKQEYPDKLLVGLAYITTSGVPTFPLADNIVVFTNLHLSELPLYTTASAGQQSMLDQWLKVAHYYANHEWYEGDGYLLPRIYSDYWSQFLQKLAAHIPSAYMHAEGYANWGFDGPKYYVLSRMWWDPQLDPQKLTSQFCEDLFGPAAPAMKTYFIQIEALWRQLDDVDGPKRKIDGWSNQFITTPASRAIIARCHDALQQATATAQTDEQKQRVALFVKCFAFSESLFDLAEAPTDEARYNHAVDLAKNLSTDKWAVYNSATPMEAITAIYKGPIKK